MKTALYPGTFDPLTNGHLSLIRRGCEVFDHLIVAVADNTPKKPLFSHEERVSMACEALKDMPNVTVEPFSGLTVEYAAQRGACALLRGLRAVSDFEYEFQLALMNRRLQRHIQTIFLMTDYQWLFISSTIVKAAASQGRISGPGAGKRPSGLLQKNQQGGSARAPPAWPHPAAFACSDARQRSPCVLPLPVICLARPRVPAKPQQPWPGRSPQRRGGQRRLAPGLRRLPLHHGPAHGSRGEPTAPTIFGFLPTEQKISAGRWAAAASRTMQRFLERGRTPLVVGGTELYRACYAAWPASRPWIPPLRPTLQPAWKRKARPPCTQNWPPRTRATPRIHPNDRQRIVRALEVRLASGRPFSWWHAHAAEAPLCQGPLLVLDAPLAWLEPRLARRMDLMLEQGALDEARAALQNCSNPAAPGWTGIGCAEALAHLQGRCTLAQCRELWLRNTRAYAKRQRTWFRARSEAVFLPPDNGAAITAGPHAVGEKLHKGTP